MIISTSSSSTARDWAPDEMARRACQEPVDASKEGDFEGDEGAFLLTPAAGGSYNFILPKTGVGFFRAQSDLPLEGSFPLNSSGQA